MILFSFKVKQVPVNTNPVTVNCASGGRTPLAENAFPKLTSTHQRSRDLKLSVNYSRDPPEIKKIQAVENGDSNDELREFRAAELSLVTKRGSFSGAKMGSCGQIFASRKNKVVPLFSTRFLSIKPISKLENVAVS